MEGYKVLTSRNEVRDLIAFHNVSSSHVVLDVETTSKNPLEARLVDVQLTGYSQACPAVFPGEFRDELSGIHVPIVAHNYKYDFHVLYRHGVDLIGKRVFDTMLMHHLGYEESDHDLASIAKARWETTYKDDFWGKYTTYVSAPEEDRYQYACLDIYYTQLLYTQLTAELASMGIPNSLVDHVHRFSASLLRTEIRGVAIDKKYLMEKGLEIKLEIERLKKAMRAQCPVQIELIENARWINEIVKRVTPRGKMRVQKPEFNFDSTKQIMALLYDELGLPVQLDEKTKKASVAEECLKRLSDSHPFIPLLLEYRGHSKVYGTYIEGTLERERDGRIYPSFNVNGTVTGRSSSSNPNLQQLPREGGVRGIYVADPGYKIISCDYGMLEVVIAAHFSKDKSLLRIIYNGESQHDITAESVGIPRQTAKTLNFAAQYGCSEGKIAKILKVPMARAKEIYRLYWDTYSGVKKERERCNRLVDEGKPIVNPFGRQRHFEVKKRDEWDQAYRQSFNSLVQGTGADLTNRAFYLTDAELLRRDIGYGMLVVHDEILIQAKENHCQEARELLIKTMLDVGKEIGLSVPLTVDCSEPMDRWL